MDHLIGLVLIATVTNKKRVVWCLRQNWVSVVFLAYFHLSFEVERASLVCTLFGKLITYMCLSKGFDLGILIILKLSQLYSLLIVVLCIKKLSYFCQKLGWLLWMARRKLWMELEIGFWGIMCRFPACGLNPFHINCPLGGKKLKSATSNLVMHERNSKLTNMHRICCSGTICFSLNL